MVDEYIADCIWKTITPPASSSESSNRISINTEMVTPDALEEKSMDREISVSRGCIMDSA